MNEQMNIVDDEKFNKQVTSHFQTFLEEFEVAQEEEEGVEEMGVKFYMQEITRMVAEDRNTLYIDFGHLSEHQPGLAEIVLEFHYAVDPLLLDVLRAVFAGLCGDPVAAAAVGSRQFWISFYRLPFVTSLRDIRSERVGSLLSLSGTVTRTSDVRPELLVGGFRCHSCLVLQPPVEQQFRYTEPRVCNQKQCPQHEKGGGGFQMDFAASTFVDWQRLRVQENADEVPSGAMPRTLDIIVRADNVEAVKAGDRYIFCGTLLAVPDVSQLHAPGEKAVRVSARGGDDDGGGGGGGGGRKNKSEGPGVSGRLRDLGVRELTYGLCFLACAIQDRRGRLFTGASGGEPTVADESEFSEEELAEIGRITQDPNLYSNLVRSVAPSVFGHDDIKRGILLMLFGGVHKATVDGISLRGDINVCVVGDPSTSKSQFLKYVASFVPRAVYTSGKASSAAGLTAAVAKDPDTGEFNVEAGALMLADNGICCIDEFDKMDPHDQVAIHEAMEQQTISISKAGIQATLMARTSVLAAANPIGGRYDKAKTLKANLNISAPIMSRFDLFFIVLDECDERADMQIAEHIIRVHQLRDSALRPPYEAAQLQLYLRYARTLTPVFTDEAEDLLVEKYRELRSEDMGAARTSYRITVRQLESMVRLAEALARLHCDEIVRVEYVEEAARLLQRSIIHIESEDILFPEAPNKQEKAPPQQEHQPLQDEMDIDRDDLPVQDDARDRAGSAEHDDDDDAERRDGDEEFGNRVQEEEPRQQIRMTFERYQQVAQMLAMYVHREMRKKRDDSDEPGVRQRDMIRWYIDQEADRLESMEMLEMETRTMRALIQRLIDVDHVLFVIEDDEENEDERILVIHPNFEIVNEDY